MIEKINNNQIADIYKDISSKQSPCSESAGKNNADASLQVSYESLLEQAKQEPANDANRIDKVERARQMLMSGELESSENIRKAAENLIKFGI